MLICVHDLHSSSVRPSLSSFVLRHAVCDGALPNAASCAALCRDVLGLCFSWRTYQGRLWDRLHYSSNEICHRRLHRVQLTVQQRTAKREEVRWGMMRRSDRKRFSRVSVWGRVCSSNYTLMNKAFCCVGVPHSSGFKAEEQTATAPLLRLTGTEQNINVTKTLGDREQRRECKTEEEAGVRGKTQGGLLKTGCDEKSFKMWRDCRKEMFKCGGHEPEKRYDMVAQATFFHKKH